MSAGVDIKEKIRNLIDSQKPNHSLSQPFYTDPEIFRHDLDHIFFNDWLYVCHTSQLQHPGDIYTFDIANESVIVSRDNHNKLHAFVNVCRHRGSRICQPGAAKVKRLVCPYHAWSYDLNGELHSARLMPKNLNKRDFGLKRLALEQFCGFIFINFSDRPSCFSTLKKQLGKTLDVFELENTKVVHHEVHPIKANWKLVYENFNECYHCAPAHKEFSASHSIMLEEQQQCKFEKLQKMRAIKAGISPTSIGLSPQIKSQNNYTPFYYDRYALFKGYQTGSEDGHPVAPLLGRVKCYDDGASNLAIGNLTYLLIYSDHVVLYRFTPRSVDLTDAEIIWFVHDHAQENVDYDLKRLTWLWNVTTIADKKIIESNQKGVLSRYYQPGPYAPMEQFTIDFINWYLSQIS